MKTTGLICTEKSSLQNATKLLHLCPYTTGVVHKLKQYRWWSKTEYGELVIFMEWIMEKHTTHSFCSVVKL